MATHTVDDKEQNNTQSKISMHVGKGSRVTIPTAGMSKEDLNVLMDMTKQNSTGAGLHLQSVLDTKKSEMAALRESGFLKKLLFAVVSFTVLLGCILFGLVVLAIVVTKDMNPDTDGVLVSSKGHAIATAKNVHAFAFKDLVDPVKVPDEHLQTISSMDYSDPWSGYLTFKVLKSERVPAKNGFEVNLYGNGVQMNIDSSGKVNVAREGANFTTHSRTGANSTHMNIDSSGKVRAARESANFATPSRTGADSPLMNIDSSGKLKAARESANLTTPGRTGASSPRRLQHGDGDGDGPGGDVDCPNVGAFDFMQAVDNVIGQRPYSCPLFDCYSVPGCGFCWDVYHPNLVLCKDMKYATSSDTPDYDRTQCLWYYFIRNDLDRLDAFSFLEWGDVEGLPWLPQDTENSCSVDSLPSVLAGDVDPISDCPNTGTIRWDQAFLLTTTTAPYPCALFDCYDVRGCGFCQEPDGDVVCTGMRQATLSGKQCVNYYFIGGDFDQLDAYAYTNYAQEIVGMPWLPRDPRDPNCKAASGSATADASVKGGHGH